MNLLQFSRRASEDLQEICRSMASVSPRAAAVFVHEIEETCRLCREHPEMSQPCDELSPGLRFLPTEGYVIFFHRLGLATEVVRILRDPRIVGMSQSPAAGAASGSFVEFAASLEELERRCGDLADRDLLQAAVPRAPDRVYHVPRKFGIGSLFVVVAFFAAIFALMRLIFVPPVVMGIVGLQVVASGAMQWTMVKRPRLASALAGAVLLPCALIAIAIWEGDADEAVSMIAAVPCTAIPGALCGYFAGTLIAGVFMVMELADESIGGKQSAETEINVDDPLAEDSDDNEAAPGSPASDG